MKKFNRFLKSFNRYQKKHRFLGFPLAVFKRYSEDNAGNQAALLTYFGFVSLFPLLMILFTVLNLLTNHNTGIEYRVIDGVVSYFPVSAQEIFNNIHSYHKTGIDLFIGLLITLYGARGIASALQNTSNNLWRIPKKRRPDFWHSLARSIGIIVLGGGGMIMTTVILSYTNNISSKGGFFKMLVTLFALLLNILVFALVFRMATAKEVRTRWLLSGAIVAGVFWQILQSFGSFLVLHQLKRSSELYGVFALVLGMLFWIYLQAEVTLLAMEANIVQRQILWPRDLFESEED